MIDFQKNRMKTPPITPIRRWITAIMIILVLAGTAGARMKIPDERDRSWTQSLVSYPPAHCLAAHRVGKIELAVSNNGTFGVNYFPGAMQDFFTGEPLAFSCQYPKGSRVEYMFGGAFWIGAVVDRDTLVSTGADGWQWVYEMYPDQSPFGEMVYRSIKDPTQPEYEGAVSEEDYISVYTDTYTDAIPADYFGRPHTPLNIRVTQATYAWSYAYAEDFVLFDYQIKNIGSKMLEQVYMGIYVDCMVCYDCMGDNTGFTDDHSGFLHTYPSTTGVCEYLDTVFIAFIADDNGDPDVVFSDGNRHPCPNVTATRIVRTPAESLDVSFNWWIGNGNPSLDFAPRERSGMGRYQEEFRDFGTGGMGTPEGDANKYYVMRNKEFDYNQVFTASIQANDSLWLLPNQDLAAEFADGYDTRYLLSFGPFDIVPGQTLPISFAYVAGENIHKVAGNESNLPDHPYTYLRNLDFSDLALNARWASWVYDNPGVDTDGDGYCGRYRVCCTDSAIAVIDTISEDPPDYDTTWAYVTCDTFYYEGDGIPDFRGAAPPPAPELVLEPLPGAIRVRFNGTRSETFRDVFSGEIDFEGYRVYCGRDERPESYSVIASYDIEDYNKYVWNDSAEAWQLNDFPFSLEELQCLYGDSCGDDSFDPLIYTRSTRYVHPLFPDSVFYFEAQDYNVSDLGRPDGIRKVYPEQAYPSSLNPDSARPDELTEDGRFKYFEYEFTMSNLLPSVPYWVNVTAFDFGSPESGLESLESSVSVGAEPANPGIASDDPAYASAGVIVYPNPYRGDGAYRSSGYEGRTESDRPDDRVRAINFANLPPKCVIRVYTLDGDLVRELEHDFEPGDPMGGHHQWDLITRNTQLVVSGLYYWTVEDEDGEVQIGKLAIIM